jgi:hypothetical protein
VLGLGLGVGPAAASTFLGAEGSSTPSMRWTMEFPAFTSAVVTVTVLAAPLMVTVGLRAAGRAEGGGGSDKRGLIRLGRFLTPSSRSAYDSTIGGAGGGWIEPLIQQHF